MEMSQLTALVRAPYLVPHPADGNAGRRQEWTNTAEQANRSGESSLGALLLEAELIFADPGLDGLLAF